MQQIDTVPVPGRNLTSFCHVFRPDSNHCVPELLLRVWLTCALTSDIHSTYELQLLTEVQQPSYCGTVEDFSFTCTFSGFTFLCYFIFKIFFLFLFFYYYISITIVLSYTRKYHEFVAVCIVTSAQHE